MPGHVTGLDVHPVKGLSAQSLEEVALTAGHGFPHDRVLALARPDGGYTPGLRTGLPKDRFYMLAVDERLAGLDTRLDTATGVLRVSVRGHEVLAADLGEPEGVAEATAFFARVLDLPEGARPLLAREEGRRFTDVAKYSDAMMNTVSLINVASVRDFGERVGAEVDPRRFRANLYVDGLEPFAERDLVDREFTIGGVRLRGVLRTKRCAATEVHPRRGRRDLSIPRLLMAEYGNSEMGVYAEVLTDGTVRPGDAVTIPEESR
ncbi:MOSC domain-containing protein [Nocardiopsis aegyptia]|uniref:MOSC domain-containing protein n=1 Tax=Nocardiopsis aegyptia TaxID=220378 RepID=UPI00366C6CEC